jgi:hypothetical protein
MKDPETDRLLAELEALPPYRGWTFSYVYPGYFCYSHLDLPHSVFFTPDWEREEVLDIQVQTNDGHDFPDYGDVLALPRGGRSGEQIAQMVRPTLDRLLGVVASAT